MSDDPLRVQVMLACNDHRNGVFAGCTDHVEVGSRNGDYHLSLCGPTLRVQEGVVNLQIGRAVYRYYGSEKWYGNWCWNRYEFSAAGAARLLNDLRLRGWGADEGFADWYERFAAGHHFTADDFRCIAGAEDTE